MVGMIYHADWAVQEAALRFQKLHAARRSQPMRGEALGEGSVGYFPRSLSCAYENKLKNFGIDKRTPYR